MAKKPDSISKSELEERVWNAISAFEQILEAMPNDRASLDALANAYEQVGDHTRARDFLIRLGDVLIEERDQAEAKGILEKVRLYSEESSEAKALLGRLESFLAIDKAAPSAGKSDAPSRPAASGAFDLKSSFNMADELSFAWNLLEAGEITQEEYASVVQDLTEMSAGDSNATISVLHVLEARAFKSLEKIIGYVSRECATPVISLACFELQAAVVALLPVTFMMRRGVLPFEFLGNTVLVVVMNPYNKQLRQELEMALGKKCHFFLALSSEFDHALAKVAQINADAVKK